ncbi:MAG: sensor histidine kinase [Chitinophagales bacterium]
MTQPFFNRMPSQYTKQFEETVVRSNAQKAIIISLLGVFFFFTLMLLDFIRWQKGQIELGNIYFWLCGSHMVMGVLMIPAYKLYHNRMAIKQNRYAKAAYYVHFCIVTVALSLVPMAVFTVFDRNNTTVFAIFILIANLVFTVSHRTRIEINVLSYVLLLMGVWWAPGDNVNRYIHILESFGMVFPTFMVATYQYNALVTHFVGEQKLANKQQELTTANEEIRQFAYAVSHDLKEPLRTIGSYTQLLERRLKDLPPSAREYMDFITDGVGRMDTMISDLLQYSRLGNIKLNVCEVNLNDTLLKVRSNLTDAIRQSEAKIIVANLPIIWAAPNQAVQLFQNLISNAIKFRRKEVATSIFIEVNEDAHDVVIMVKDNGIGIEEKYQKQVFDIFRRLHTRNEYEGSGIGLASCKRIVEKMGGKIWISSVFGRGTTIYCSLPKKKQIPQLEGSKNDTLKLRDGLKR